MRYISYQHIEIDTHNQIVSIKGESVTLAPKVYDLLLYFCQNSQRVISKDELMEQVWAGTLVTENAISRTLVKVRKALNDDPKSPEFIVTVPRKGYRMSKAFEVSDVSQNITFKNASAAQSHNNTSSSNSVTYIRYILSVAALLLVVLWWQTSDNYSHLETKQVEALTRNVGQEIFPAISPDLTHLSYTKTMPGGGYHIVIEELGTGRTQVVQQRGVSISRMAWSNNGNQVAFVAKSKQSCTIYLSDLDKVTHFESWQVIANCGEFSSPHLVFAPDKHQLFFSDKVTNTNGYQIFKVNLTTGQKEILNQPITSGKGNYSFDISPSGEYLVLLNSEFEPKTAIYTLNLTTSELERTGLLDYLMRSVAYHHDDTSLIHPSPHPAYELWQSDLSGEKLAVVASNTSRVKHVQRLNNGQDFTYVSYLLNRDITYTANSDVQGLLSSTVENNNSSVMDYLPALSNHSSSYAFVSKRSSESQVYLVKELEGVLQSPVRLTNFEQHIKLYQLAFSPQDKQLIILADNQLVHVDLETEIIQTLPLHNLSIQGVSWKSEQALIFTTIKNNNRYVETYDLVTKQLSDIATDFVGGVYLPELKQFALLSSQGESIQFIAENGQAIKSLSVDCQPTIISRKLNLQLDGNSLVCFSTQADKYIQIDTATGEQNNWHYQPFSLDFDVNKHGLIQTQMTQAIADVMRTRGH